QPLLHCIGDDHYIRVTSRFPGAPLRPRVGCTHPRPVVLRENGTCTGMRDFKLQVGGLRRRR
ncbi:hypothetical protein C8Q80DRAFT_1166001, partial [Daedaleopsis nitida]